MPQDEQEPRVHVVPVTRDRLEDLAELFRGSEAATCWDMVPRTTAAEERTCVSSWKESGLSVRAGRQEGFAALTSRDRAPGLMAYLDGQPAGWISLGPRSDYPRVANSKATPAVDDANVWIVPCLLVHRRYRGQGVTAALIDAASDHACANGAEALEAYPRPNEDRPSPAAGYFGTVGLFAKSGFEVVRPPIEGLPKNWVRRYAMRRSLRQMGRRAGRPVRPRAGG